MELNRFEKTGVVIAAATLYLAIGGTLIKGCNETISPLVGASGASEPTGQDVPEGFDPLEFEQGWSEVQRGTRFDQDPSQFGSTESTNNGTNPSVNLEQFDDAFAEVMAEARFDNPQN